MSARTAVLAVCGLVVLLLATCVPAPTVSAPPSVDSFGSQCQRALVSSIHPLPPYSPKDVWINYTVNGSRGDDGLRWTELWYQGLGSEPWVLYAPPWNPSGHWIGTSPKDHSDDSEEDGHTARNGTIIFDTTFTGGDGHYNFTTVAVGRHHLRESGPPDLPGTVKANTTVDSQAPILFLTKPSPGSWTNSEWVEWRAIDSGSGIDRVSVSVDGGPVHSSSDANGSMNMSLTTQGSHNVVVTATDRAGNAITIPSSFHYDTNAPSLAITSPGPYAYLDASSVEVNWTATDPAGIASLQLTLDSGSPMSLPNETVSFALTGLAESEHLVSLLAADQAGNVAIQTVSFTVDTTPPILQIVSPANGSYSNSRQLQALWMGSDSGSGIDHYRISLDGMAPITVVNAPGYLFPNVAEGPHTLAVQAYDRAGNTAQAASSVIVDTIPPVLGITSPSPGSTVYGTVSVNWTASDTGSGLAQVILTLDNGALPVAAGQVTLTLPASLSAGAHAVTLRAWDRAGNENLTTLAFTYGGAARPSPAPASVPAIDFWWIMAAVLLIAVASAYLAVRRRKKPKT